MTLRPQVEEFAADSIRSRVSFFFQNPLSLSCWLPKLSHGYLHRHAKRAKTVRANVQPESFAGQWRSPLAKLFFMFGDFSVIRC